MKLKKALSIIWLFLGSPIVLVFMIAILGMSFDHKTTLSTIVVVVILTMILIVTFGLPFYLVVLRGNGSLTSFASAGPAALVSSPSRISDWFARFFASAPFFGSRIFKDLQKAGKLSNWKAELPRLEGEKPLKPSAKKNLGLNLYDYFLKKALEDLDISQTELDGLVEIVHHFEIPKPKIASIHSRYATKALTSLSRLALQDNVLTSAEKEQMYKLGDFLGLANDRVDAINRSNALAIFSTARDAALADKRLTSSEEQELSLLRTNLGLSESDVLLSGKKAQEYAYYKLLWEIENGNLPEIAAPVVLTKGEVAHVLIDANRLDSKVVTTGYAGGSRGVSIRIMKGVSYRVGNYRGHAIKQQVTTKIPGNLIITSKKLVFASADKAFTIPFTKLASFTPYSDGMAFLKDSTTYLLQFKNVDLVGMILTTAVRKFMDE